MPHSSALFWRARPSCRVYATLLFLVVAARPAAAAAQQPTPTGDSTAATFADSIAAAHAQRLAPQFVSATRLSSGQAVTRTARIDALPLRDTPSGPAMAATALGRVPGVAVFDDQGTRAQPSLDLRGFELSPVVGPP